MGCAGPNILGPCYPGAARSRRHPACSSTCDVLEKLGHHNVDTHPVWGPVRPLLWTDHQVALLFSFVAKSLLILIYQVRLTAESYLRLESDDYYRHSPTCMTGISTSSVTPFVITGMEVSLINRRLPAASVSRALIV